MKRNQLVIISELPRAKTGNLLDDSNIRRAPARNMGLSILQMFPEVKETQPRVSPMWYARDMTWSFLAQSVIFKLANGK